MGRGDRSQPSLRAIVGAGGTGVVATMFGMNAVDDVDRAAVAVLGPDIQRTFGISDTMLGIVISAGSVATVLCAIPLAVLGDRVRRTRVVAAAACVWAVFALIGAVTQNVWQLVAARIGIGTGKGTEAVQRSLLADAYPLEGRGRVFAVHQFANPFGSAVGPLIGGGAAALVGGTAGWRWALVVLAVPAVVFGLAALWLREPERGRYEIEAVFGEPMSSAPAATTTPTGPELGGGGHGERPISLAVAWERLKRIRTYFAIMSAFGVVGVALFGVPTVLNLFLEERYGLGSFGRGVVAAGVTVGGGIGVVVGGVWADRLFRSDPPRVLRLAGAAVMVYGVTLPVSLTMSHPVLYTLINAVGSFSVSFVLAPAAAVVAAIVPFAIRSVGFAMIPIYAVLVGGFGGAVLTGLLSDAYGRRTALMGVVVPAMVFGGVLLVHGSRFVRGDISLVAQELREEREERERLAALDPDDVPAIQVRGLDVAHGPVCVLFDVDLDVRRGEVLAVLGTNGAGKSTLLRAISGLELPTRGAVRFAGRTVTFTSVEDRVRLGVVHVPGGKAVFPGLTVQENLLCGTYTLLGDVTLARDRIRRSVELVPILRDKLNQPAGTLSGGEQQMLAIAKALVLEPDVLIIDELSLGLAPAVVEELLAILDRLRSRGVTMILVEQSIGVATSVADRAVFLDRGRVRFDGPADELAGRDDLVRAVFLGTERG